MDIINNLDNQIKEKTFVDFENKIEEEHSSGEYGSDSISFQKPSIVIEDSLKIRDTDNLINMNMKKDGIMRSSLLNLPDGLKNSMVSHG